MFISLLSLTYKKLSLIRYRLSNGIYGSSHIAVNKNTRICFDFSNSKYIHYGDMLFYLPLIFFLSKSYKISILPRYSDLKFINFFNIDSENINFIYSANDFEGIIISSPYLYFDHRDNPRYYGLGMPNKLSDIPYPAYLAKMFSDYFIKNNNFYDEFIIFFSNWKNNFKSKIINKYCNYIYFDNMTIPNGATLVSPYMASGRFRDFLGLKRNQIVNNFIDFSAHEFTPILVGSISDKYLYLDNLIDLRGVEITDIMILSCSPTVVNGIGFDNFWMHFFDLIGKKYHVKFRGRIIKFNRELHMKSINISFCEKINKNYI